MGAGRESADTRALSRTRRPTIHPRRCNEAGAAVGKVALVAHWDWVLYHFRLPLARRLRDRGLTVDLVSPPGPYVARLKGEGFPWHRWPVSRRGLNPAAEALAVSRLATLYRRERFDVVHHFTIKPVIYGSLAARVAGIAHVFNTFTGLGFVFSDGLTPTALRALVRPLLRRALRGAGVVTVFQNPADRDRLVQSGLVQPQQCRVIVSTGVDLDRFAPPAVVDGDVPVVILAARLLWDKGIGEFVHAARALRARAVAARFLVAGAPDPGNPRAIPREQIARWASEGPVEFLGLREDMPELLRRAQVAVLPSYHEGVPRFLLEAAATGLALVGTDIPGCRMAIDPGVNGFLVPPRDGEALADALERLLRDPDLRHRMGRASRAIAVERFDERAVLDAYERLYSEAGMSPRAPTPGP